MGGKFHPGRKPKSKLEKMPGVFGKRPIDCFAILKVCENIPCLIVVLIN
jgi:hypothetical protein